MLVILKYLLLIIGYEYIDVRQLTRKSQPRLQHLLSIFPLPIEDCFKLALSLSSEILG